MNVNPSAQITIVKVLKDIPLDTTYKDTIKFTNSSSQEQYFSSKTKYTYDGLTPIRLQNMMRLPVVADHLFDCNYLMFKNAAFSFKWMYAFITKVNYINTNMCEVEFELDVWQTWMFDINFKRCFVEREHISEDSIGANTVAESVDYGYYVSEGANKTPFFESYTAVICTSAPTRGGSKTGGIVGGTFSGLDYIGGQVDDESEVNSLLETLQMLVEGNLADSIVSLFMMPTAFYATGSEPRTQLMKVDKRNSKIGNYTPRNKKLLTYPFNMLYVFACDGQSAVYRYEFFNSGQCEFNFKCGMGCNPEIIASPLAYDGQNENLDESLTMSGFPQVGYAIDSFRAYLAQNSSTIGLNLIGGAIGTITGVSQGVQGAVGGIMGLASSINTIVQESIRPPQARGNQGRNTYIATGDKNYYFVNKHINEETARNIDDYFDMYGYAVNKLKVPNLSSRPSWNYVKTNRAVLTGSVPFDDISKLRNTLDNGITFWHGDWVGDYGRNNRP